MAIFSKLWITKPSRFILGDNSAETQEVGLILFRVVHYAIIRTIKLKKMGEIYRKIECANICLGEIE